MKKIFVLILLLTFFIVSCDNNQDLIENDSDSLVLTEKLNNFNETYRNNHIGMIEYRSFWSVLAKVVAVAGADVIGAGAGIYAGKEIAVLAGAATGGTGTAVVAGVCGVLGGAGTSIAAGSQVNGLIYNPTDSSGFEPVEYYQGLAINYPDKYAPFSDLGIKHNYKLFTYYNQGERYNEDDTIESFLVNNLEWQSVNNELYNCILLYSSDYNYDMNLLLNKLVNKSLISPKMKTVYSLFFEIYNKTQNDYDVKIIVNFYINSVAISEELSELEKNSLIASFSVASESPFWWANQNFN